MVVKAASFNSTSRDFKKSTKLRLHQEAAHICVCEVIIIVVGLAGGGCTTASVLRSARCARSRQRCSKDGKSNEHQLGLDSKHYVGNINKKSAGM
jgi:hypothetical protein